MKNLLLLTAFACCSTLFAQESHQTYYADGQLKAEYVLSGDRILVSMFHANGQLAEEGTILNGQAHATWKQYDDSGVLLVQGKFDEGRRIGRWQHFSADGSLALDLRYGRNGLIEGQRFNAEGEVIAVK